MKTMTIIIFSFSIILMVIFLTCKKQNLVAIMKTISIWIMGFVFVLISCQNDKKEQDTKINPPIEQTNSSSPISNSKVNNRTKIKINLESKTDSNIKGNVVFVQEKGIVTMIAVLSGLTPGKYLFSIYEKNACSINKLSTDKHLKERIGTFTANEKGQGTITHITENFCIDCEDFEKNLIEKTIIISQEENNISNVVLCGTIVK